MDKRCRKGPGKGCGVCASPDCGRVEGWLVKDGDSIRFVSKRSGFSRPALKRHLHHHSTLEELKRVARAG